MLPFWLALAIETEEDRSKMELLYDKYERLLFSVAFSYLHDTHRAEDAVHDTFLKLIPNLNKITDVNGPQTKGFIVTITKNICINMIRRKSYTSEIAIENEKGQHVIELIPDSYSSTEDDIFDRYEILRIKEALTEMPDYLRNTLIMYASEGLSMKEIAEIDECTVEAVKKRIQRARRLLLNNLREEK